MISLVGLMTILLKDIVQALKGMIGSHNQTDAKADMMGGIDGCHDVPSHQSRTEDPDVFH